MRELFNEIYVDFRRRQDGYLASERYSPFFRRGRALPFPPVIGFGLPRRGEEKIPVVTIATNPSTAEFDDRHLLRDENVDVQWFEQSGYFDRREGRGPYRDWFNFSNDLLTEVRSDLQCSHYEFASNGDLVEQDHRSNQRVPHLDLTPIATHGSFATVDKTVPDKSVGESLLREGIQFCLLPLLERLVTHHDTRLAVLFGYLPDAAGDDLLPRTLRGLFVQSDEQVTIRGKAPNPTISVARGSFARNHRWTRGKSYLGRLSVVFCSHGPSYLNSPHIALPRTGNPPSKYSDSMTAAGRQIRAWFPEAWWSAPARSQQSTADIRGI